MHWKKRLANWLIRIAFKLDKFQLEQCTFNINGPQIRIKASVPEDSKWHNVNMSLSYWLYVGGDKEKKAEGKEVTYVDGVHLCDRIVDSNYQTKVVTDDFKPGPGFVLENRSFELWR